MLKNNLKKSISGNKVLLVILVISFSLSIFYSFHFKIEPAVDARAYDDIAVNLISGNGYREIAGTDLALDNAIVRIGPFYEYFLAITYKLFGHHLEVVWILQAILHALSAYLVYLICLLIFAGSSSGKKIGLWAAAILGLYPDLIEISAMLLTETFYIFFTCLVLYLFFLYIKTGGLKTFLLLYFVSGVAILVRPPLVLFLPVIFFYLYRKKEWRKAVLMTFTIILVFLPWTIRNYNVYKEIMPLGVAGPFNFWIGNFVGANGEQNAGQEILDYTAVHKPAEYSKESMKRFTSFVLEHPREFTKLTLLRMNKYFSIIRPMGFWFYSKGWEKAAFIASSTLFSFFVFIFGSGGIVYYLRRNDNHLLKYLLAFTVATPLLIFITVVETRYRFQIYPLLAVFCAYFVNIIMENKTYWSKSFALGSLIILSNGLADLYLSLDKFKERFLNTFLS